ncbi:NADH-quinone oxidoreductase subunit A [Candidatus Marinimicrobia bacterium MT.SAG.3]|nr:NADH-quinone oxidoreductase subunit A [Candidatus Neomarinimicrobiota bacterium]TFB10578.1 NADH-quinone oxidoreductase subunit A [Candidatus Marinimicrobia bacterium MT.SAG.2]TFB11036.1 NADH-quinone oxidoreductase subunit A [Candidatus Marinimicrobia bacterium MT.SAG.3]TFB13317.1 NADH-quinone oxidoreductase subunit A [Candidatus Marinimicrobia bacterium MT.SAG.4]
MLGEYLPLFFLIVIVFGLVTAMLILTRLLQPKRRSEQDLEPYESGTTPSSFARIRFSVKFFIIAIIFIIFDIEVVFMYPWAIVFKELLNIGTFIFIEMLTFLGILVVGLIYVWKMGALEWD